MTKREIRKAVKAIFPEAKIRFIYDLAQVDNWREMEGGRYGRTDGKEDFYAKLREAGLVERVMCGA